MTTVLEIPLSPTPQTFPIILSGVQYQLMFKWNNANEAGWLMDIADLNGNAIVTSLPLVTGENLITQLAYLGIGGAFVIQTDHNADAVPTFTNLGETSHVYYITA